MISRKMKFRKYKNNKLLLFLPVALLLVATVLIFNSKVLSESEIDRNVIFNNESWKIGSDFDKEWYTNSDTISFEVDLSGDLTNWNNTNTDLPLPEERPFKVTAKYDYNKTIASKDISYTKIEDPEFTGKYQVDIPFEKEKKLEITVRVDEENSWDISASQGKFQITRDVTIPQVVVSPIENIGEPSSKQDVALKINVTETNFSKNGVTVGVTENGINKAITPNWNQKTNGTWEGTSLFSSNGEYVVNVNVKDKAGNMAAPAHTSFAINKVTPALSVSGIETGATVLNNGFANTKNIQFKVNNGIEIKDAKITISAENGEIEPQEAVLTVGDNKLEASLNHSFAADGKYEISGGTLTDNKQTFSLAPFSFVIDPLAPEISVKDGAGNELPAYKEEMGDATLPIYTSDQEMKIKISDTHFNKNKVEISGTKKGSDGTEVSLNADLAVDQYGKSSLDATAEGVYEINIMATDDAGNKATKRVKFVIDRKPPIVDHNINQNGKFFKKKDFSLSILDITLNRLSTGLKVTRTFEGTTVDYTSEIANPISGLFNLIWSHEFIKDGVYQIEIDAIDMANQESDKNPIMFTIDSTLPVPYIRNVEKDLYDASLLGVEIGVDDTNIDLANTKLTIKKDGSNLDVDSLKVNGATASNRYDFTKDGEYSIELETVDLAGNEAKATPVSFTIDTKTPKLEISKITDGAHYKEAITDIVASVEDLTLHEATLELKRDNESILFDFLKGNGNNANLNKVLKSLDLSVEGDYELILIGKDRNGKITEQRITFTIDFTAPAIEFSGIDNDSFVKNGSLKVKIEETNFETNNVKITATRQIDRDSEPEPFQIIEENPDWEKVGKEAYWEQLFNQDGDYVIKVEATDKAQNENSKEISFTIDNVKPDIKISNFADEDKFYNADRDVTIKVEERNYEGNHVTIDVTKKLEANDEKSPISIEEFKKDGEISSLTQLFTEDGEYEITVKSVDEAGNIAEEKWVKFTVDKIAPVLSILGVDNSEHYNLDKFVEIKASDRNLNATNKDLNVTRNGKEYHVGQLEQTGTEASRGFTFTEEGSYIIDLTTTDLAGNKTKHDPIAFIIDKTNPVLNIVGAENQSFNPGAKSVTVSVDELNFGTNAVELTAKKDGKSFNIGQWNNSAELSKLGYNFDQDGFYSLLITAKDKAGNGPIEASKTFTIDTVKPMIDISGVQNNEHYNIDKPVTATIKDVNLDINKISVTKDGAPYQVGGFAVEEHQFANSVAKLTHNFRAEGDYEMVVEATDKAGNKFSQQVKFTIDKTKPVITPKFKGENRGIKDGEYINKMFTPEFALDVREDMIVSVILNDGANVKNNIPLASTEMVYHYKVLAADKAGNQTTLEVSFTLDTSKPKLDVSGILDGFFNKDMIPKVTYSDKHLDESRTSVTLNGKPFVNGKKLDFEQDYVFKAVITDLANNVTTRTIVFTIDKTSPVIKFTEPISNKYFKEDIIPQLLIEDFSEYDIITQTLDGKAYKLGTPVKEEGKHVFYFEVKDAAGNIKQISVEFIIDKTAPKVIYKGVKKDAKYNNPVTIRIHLDNPMDDIKEVTINGEVFDGEIVMEDGYKVIKTTVSDINSYKIKVVATDSAGNEISSVLPFDIVEKSLIVKFYENKPVFMGSIVGLVMLMGILATVVLRKKKDDEVEEEA